MRGPSSRRNFTVTPPVLAPRTQNGIEFGTGGVGRDRSDAFRAVASDFSLRATFSGTGGAFLANVKLELRDRRGQALVTTSTEGPFFFAKVPAGTYDLIASIDGQMVRRRMVVSAGAAATTDVVFRVPAGR